MRITWKNIALTVVVIAAFVPITVFSPETVTEHLNRWFNIRPPVPPPQEKDTGRWARAASVRASVTEAEVADRLNHLASNGSRVVGYPGHEAAAQYILEEFRRIGLERVTTESYDVTSPIDKGASLRVLGGSRAVPIYAVWPNLVRTSTLPGEGLRAPLIDGGTGQFSDFNGEAVDGSAVLMSFNSWNRWMNASMLGAKAVVFVAPDSTTTAEAEQKFFQVPTSRTGRRSGGAWPLENESRWSSRAEWTGRVTRLRTWSGGFPGGIPSSRTRSSCWTPTTMPCPSFRPSRPARSRLRASLPSSSWPST